MCRYPGATVQFVGSAEIVDHDDADARRAFHAWWFSVASSPPRSASSLSVLSSIGPRPRRWLSTHAIGMSALDTVRHPGGAIGRRELTSGNYETEARDWLLRGTALIAEAIRESGDRRSRRVTEAYDSRDATWRERALNAEDALNNAHTEILAQRHRIGELLGRIPIWKPNGTGCPSGSPRRTPRSKNACASSAPTVA